MNWMEFLASLVSSLAWPVALAVLVFMLRHSIAALIPALRRLKYKDLELDFRRDMEEVREEVNQGLPAPPAGERLVADSATLKLLDASPRAAVLEAWYRVEMAVMDTAKRLALAGPFDIYTALHAIKVLERAAGIDQNIVSILHNLRRLRNLAAHAPDFELSRDSGMDYVASADRVVRYLEQVQVPHTGDASR